MFMSASHSDAASVRTLTDNEIDHVAGGDSPEFSPSANSGLGGVGDLVGGLAGGAGTLGFLLPSPNGSGANFVNGLMNYPAGAITGTPNSILPYGLLDGGKPQPL